MSLSQFRTAQIEKGERFQALHRSGSCFVIPNPWDAAGVTRISVGSSFARAALGAFDRAASEVLKEGTFSYASEALPHGELNGLFRNR